MPRLQALYTELKNKGLAAIALTLQNSYDKAEQYFRDSRYSFPSARISPEFTSKNHFSIAGKPVLSMTTVVVDAHRRIIFRDHETDYEDLRAVLSNLGIK